MKCFVCLLTVILFLTLYVFTFVECKISDERLCADEHCSVLLSEAKTILGYNSDDERILSFKPKENAKIFSKSAGTRKDLWGGEINGKRGYIPKDFVRENRVFKTPTITVSTEENKSIINETFPVADTSQNELKRGNDMKGAFFFSGASADSVPSDIQPQKANNYEVIDGTKIYDEDSDKTPPSMPDEPIDTSSETPALKLNEEPKDSTESTINNKIDVLPNDEGGKTNQDSQPRETVDKSVNVERVEQESVATEPPSALENKENQIENKPVLESVYSMFKDSLLFGGESNEEIEKENEKDVENRVSTTLNEAKNEDEVQLSPTLEMAPTPGINMKFDKNKVKSDKQHVDAFEKRTNYAGPKNLMPLPTHALNERPKPEEGKLEPSKKEEITENKTDVSGDTGTMPDDASSSKIEGTDLMESLKAKGSSLPEGLPNLTIEDSGESTTPSPFVNASMQHVSDTMEPPTIISNSKPESSEVTGLKENTTEFDPNNEIEDSVTNNNITEKKTAPNNEIKDSDTEKDTVELETASSSDIRHLKTDKNIELKTPSSSEIKDGDGNFTETVTDSINEKTDADMSKPVAVSSINSEDLKTDEYTREVTTPSNEIKDEVTLELETASNNEVEGLKTNDSSISEPVDTRPTNEIKVDDNVHDSVLQSNVTNTLDEEAKDSLNVLEDAPRVMKSDETLVTENEQTVTEVFTLTTDIPHINTAESSMPSSPDLNIMTTEVPHEDTKGDKQPLLDVQSESVVTESPTLYEQPDITEFSTKDSMLELEVREEENANEEESVGVNASESVEHMPAVVNEGGFSTFDEVAQEPVTGAEDTKDTTQEFTGGMFSWIVSIFSGSKAPIDHTDEVVNIAVSHTEEVSSIKTSHPEEQPEKMWVHESHLGDSQEGSCSIPEFGEDKCNKVDPIGKSKVWTSSKSSNADFVMMSAINILNKVPIEMTLLLIVTALAVLIFTLGFYYIEAHRRDGSLVARINTLERDLLVKKKENSILEDAFTNAQFEVKGRDTDLTEIKETNEELLLELEELKAMRLDLEEQVTSLEKELETVTESGLEMHRLLSESLSSQDGSQVLLQTVESLREKLDKQDAQIVLLNRNLEEQREKTETLENQLSSTEEEKKILNEKFNSLKREKQEEELLIKEKNLALMVQLEEVSETKALEESRLSTEMSKLRISLEEVQRKLVEREAEVEAMKESIRLLRATDQDENIQELYDVAAVSAKLTTTLAERDEYREKFIEEEGARKLLEDHVRVISREVAELKNNFEAAEKEKIEALTKLKVLSNYFKEKETELQKELGTQESLWLQKQGDDHTIYEQMRSLREENEKFNGEPIITLGEVKTKRKKTKTKLANDKVQQNGLQNESLKKEICEQESSFKIQLANVEQRAHENWVASRQAERRLKEVQQEATQLRNRLTLSEKNAVNHEDPNKKINEANGDPSSPPPSLMYSPTTSPPFMMYHGMGPIPPNDFIPPPPLIPPFSPDSRPPPLGRISSPPLDPRFSPPPPHMPFSPYDYGYGHHSPSPPLPLPHRTVHKPQPREAGREPKDLSFPPPGLGLLFEPPPPYHCSPEQSNRYNTLTSNSYSLETSDKPSRRSKR